MSTSPLSTNHVLSSADKTTNQADITSELTALLKAQKLAFQTDTNPSLDTRLERLNTLYDSIYRYRAQLADAVSQDFGNRPESETQLAEIAPLIEGIRYHKKHLPKWLKMSRRSVPHYFAPAQAYVQYQPLGSVGIIAPWNYPIFLSLGPLATALAAGNRALIKVSEFCPHTGETLKSIIGDAFPADTVSVITGGAEVGAAFSKLAFDHLLFTGSTSIGKKVMASAAANLTPVTLELGGKSPVIIGQDADLKSAVKSIAFGKCINAGQTCVAPDYVLCPNDKMDHFIELFKSQVNQMYPALHDNEDFCSIINERQYRRLLNLKTDASNKGATLIETELLNEPNEQRKLAPTIVKDITDEMLIAQDEIFGPLLGLIPYDTLDVAIDYVTHRPRPLALYYFGNNDSDISRVVEQTHSGGVAINDTLAQVAIDDLPFGGIGPSGMGQYHGHEGFLTFSKAKSVLRKGRFNSTQLIYPPWNRLPHRLLFKYIIRSRR